MEEDIKILEEYLKPRLNAKTHLGYEVVRYPELEAIDNLVKGYRELEKENEKLIYELQEKEHEIKCANRDIKVFETEFIPKSKIKEKIEELNNYDSEFCQRVLNHNEHTLTEFVQNILQELMEDK